MTSIWKDLLFLHGHLLHREELIWRHDSATEQPEQRAAPAAEKAPAAAAVKPRDCGTPACA
jgi:hypothetical protein